MNVPRSVTARLNARQAHTPEARSRLEWVAEVHTILETAATTFDETMTRQQVVVPANRTRGPVQARGILDMCQAVASYLIVACRTVLWPSAPSLTPLASGCLVRVSPGSALPDVVSARLMFPPRAFIVSGALPATLMLMAAFRSRSMTRPQPSHV